MTKLFLLYLVGHCGGAWFAAVCGSHPSKILVTGESHAAAHLGFGWPIPHTEYDQHLIAFLNSRLGKDDAVGIVKSFFQDTVIYVKKRHGRIVQLVRNPVVLVGWKTGRHAGEYGRDLGRPVVTCNDTFEAACKRYAKMYARFAGQKYPIIRLEDWNVSLAGDGSFFRDTMEYITQLKWTQKDIDRVRRDCPPQSYQWSLKRDKKGNITGGMRNTPRNTASLYGTRQAQPWRQGWIDNTPETYWAVWSRQWKEMYQEIVGPVAKEIGYAQYRLLLRPASLSRGKW